MDNKKGFYFFYGGKEYFIITNKTNKNNNTAIAILNHMQAEINDTNISFVKNRMQRAELEHKPYGINIFGDNFGGGGDSNTIIINE